MSEPDDTVRYGRRRTFLLVAATSLIALCIVSIWSRGKNYTLSDAHYLVTSLMVGGRPSRWSTYRIKAIVNGQLADFESRDVALRTYELDFPGSIATEYLHRTIVPDDFDTLARIVRDRSNVALPRSDTIVVHLRLGDVVLAPASELWETVELIGPVDGTKYYVKPRSYYERILPLLPSNVSTVVLVGFALHDLKGTIFSGKRDPHETRSAEYRQLVQAWFESKGFIVKNREDQTPDDDLVFMSNAEFYVYSGGGFSRIVGECVKRLGGKVFGDWEWRLGNYASWEEVLNRPTPALPVGA